MTFALHLTRLADGTDGVGYVGAHLIPEEFAAERIAGTDRRLAGRVIGEATYGEVEDYIAYRRTLRGAQAHVHRSDHHRRNPNNSSGRRPSPWHLDSEQ